MRWLAVAVAALVGVGVAAAVALPYLVDTPRIQAYVAGSASQALGRPVTFRAVRLRVLPLPAVELRDLEVAEDPRFSTAPFLRLDRGRVRLRLLPLLRGQVELGDIVLDSPAVTVVQASDGRLNLETLGASADPRMPARPPRPGAGSGAVGAVATARVRVNDGTVAYVARGSGGATSQYRLSDVDLVLTGGAREVGVRGSARLQPGDLRLALSEGQVALGGARALTEAALRGRVALDGKDVGPLAAVAVGPQPALGGAIKATLALGGTLGAPTAAGDVTVSTLTVTQTNPQCPEPRRRTLSVPTLALTAAWEGQRLTGRPLNATLDGGRLTGQLTATLDGGVRVELRDLAITALPLEKVLVDYLCQGYAITGPLDLTGALRFETRDVVGTLSGPGQLRVGAGRVVGPQALALIANVVRVGGAISSILSADLPSRFFEAPLDFDSITGTYTLTSGLATTQDLLYTSRAMRVLVAGDYHLVTTRMNLDMTITHGRGEVKARVTGTAASPSIRVSPSSVLRDIDPGKAERGLQELLRRFRR